MLQDNYLYHDSLKNKVLLSNNRQKQAWFDKFIIAQIPGKYYSLDTACHSSFGLVATLYPTRNISRYLCDNIHVYIIIQCIYIHMCNHNYIYICILRWDPYEVQVFYSVYINHERMNASRLWFKLYKTPCIASSAQKWTPNHTDIVMEIIKGINLADGWYVVERWSTLFRFQHRVFDKLIWRTIGPKSFLHMYLALHSSLFGPVVQLIMIIMSLTAYWLKMYSQWRTH